jgi:hypothetical protein
LHWDDDDFSAPTRIEDQVKRLIATGAPITGYRSMVFVDSSGQRWFYDGAEKYALGTSLCYRRPWWQMHPFGDMNEGEDNDMVYHSPKIICVAAGDLMFARIHSGNTSVKKPLGGLWIKL